MSKRFMNINDIRRSMSKIRRAGDSVVTNYYAQCNDVVDDLPVWMGSKTIVFEWNDNGIKRIYFYSADVEELETILVESSEGSVIDYLTKDKTQLSELFHRAGYALHLEYGRFHIENGAKSEEAKEIDTVLHNDNQLRKEIFEAPYGEMATIDDAEEIDRQLREEFDPYEAHFYSLEKLREHIKKGWVWVAKENGKIIAANLFEIQGRKAYGAYLYNRGEINVMLSLLAKTDAAIAKMNVLYAYCWMRLNNKRIIRYNMKYNGYVQDDLYDMIYVKG